MDPTSRPSSRASVRSDAPIPPPKPVHLTLSLRQGQPRARPGMPRWSRAGSVFGAGKDGQVTESEEDEEEDEGENTLHAPRGGGGREVSLLSLRGTVQSGSGSTLRPAGAAKTQGTRLSILFNMAVDNPLERVSTVKARREEHSVHPTSLTPSSSANATGGGEEGDPTTADDGGAESEDMVLDITGPALKAVSTHAFEGEAAFGKLSFGEGEELEIEVGDLGGNWSLGWVVEDGESGRGLIPIGYYKLLDPTAQLAASAASRPQQSRTATPPEPTSQLSTPSSERPLSPSPAASNASSTHFSILNLFDEDSPAEQPPSNPSRDPQASAGRAALADELGLDVDSSPATPRTPNTPRSIGRRVVVSGVEFEPTGPVLSEEDVSYFPPQGPPLVDAAVALSGAAGDADPMGSARAVSGDTPPGQMIRDARDSWPTLSSHISITTEWTPPKASDPDASSLPLTPPSAQKAWADSPRSRQFSRHSTDSLPGEGADLVPPLAPFTFAPGARLSLTDSRALMGFKDTDVRPRIDPSETDAQSAAEKDAANEGLLARAAETIGRGYNCLVGGGLDGRPRTSGEQEMLDVEATNELEEWILGGDGALLRLSTLGEGPVFDIDSGPAWRPSPPMFTVHVHSPAKRHSLTSGDYTVFQLTTVFSPPEPSPVDAGFAHAQYQSSDSVRSAAAATVDRRYSHFVALHRRLRARYPVLGVPDLPDKSFKGRDDAAFVESRRRDLERWLSRVGRHPVLSQAEELRVFLVEEEDRELDRMLSGVGGEAGEGVGWFLGRVLHPDFNVDVEEAEEVSERFGRHVKATEVGGGVKQVEQDVGHVREGLHNVSSQYSSLARSLIRLASGQALPPPSLDHAVLGPDGAGDADEGGAERQRRRAREWCLQSEQGGYTFKEEDEGGLSLAKAVQAAGEAMAAVAGLYEEQARTHLLPVQELLREAASPHSQNASLLATHHRLLTFHSLLSSLPSTPPSAEALARTDTLLNLTSAELDHAHASHQLDLRTATAALLDAHLATHRAALAELEFARAHFDEGAFEGLAGTGPRLRSGVERGARDGVAEAQKGPLLMPSGYGLPRGLLGRRLTEGVGSLLWRSRGAEVGTATKGTVPAPTAGTMRQPSVAEILAAQERGEVVGWRGSYLDSSITPRTSTWV